MSHQELNTTTEIDAETETCGEEIPFESWPAWTENFYWFDGSFNPFEPAHQHTRDCYDDPGPGHGQAAPVCGLDELPPLGRERGRP